MPPQFPHSDEAGCQVGATGGPDYPQWSGSTVVWCVEQTVDTCHWFQSLDSTTKLLR